MIATTVQGDVPRSAIAGGKWQVDAEHRSTITSASDDELLDRVREGDMASFGELWSRHAGPARSVARGFSGLDADDLVAEAFERLLMALRNGKGPRGAFRPYLIMTVRNVGRSHYQGTRLRQDLDLDLMIDDDAVDGEHAAIRDQHHRAAAEAFQSLPPRWREALWYSEVDGLPPREISKPLGLSANAVSALLVRAKRGFRDAWVSAQLAKADSDACRAVVPDIGAYTRDGLAPRAANKVEVHLETCTSCQAALAEAKAIAQTLALAILPAVAGTAGAASYLSTMRPPAMPEMQLPVTTAAASADGILDEADAPSSRGKVAALAAVLLLLFIGGAVAAVVLLDRPSETGLLEPREHESLPDGSPPLPRPVPSTRPPVTPTPLETVPPIADPGTPPSRRLLPPLAPTERIAPPAAQTPPRSRLAPGPIDAQLSQPDGRMYPRVSGSTAVPGALIRVLGSAGAIIATTTADGAGRWSAAVTDGAPGAATISATQTVWGITSAASAPLTYTVTDPPSASAPAEGNTVNAERFNFRLGLPAGSVIQRSITGQTPVQTLTVPASGVWNEYLALPVGEHVMRLRWANPDTRDVGPWVEIPFTAK